MDTWTSSVDAGACQVPAHDRFQPAEAECPGDDLSQPLTPFESALTAGGAASDIAIAGLGIWTPHYASAETVFDALIAPEPDITLPALPGAKAMDAADLWPEAVRAIAAGVAAWNIDLNGCPMVFATAKGDIRRVIRHLDSPDTAPPRLADDARLITDQCGFSDQVVCISAACASSLAALCEAHLILATQPHKPRVAVITVDLAAAFVIDGFCSLRAAADGRCRPFDARRTGLTIGSAAAWAHLERVGHRASGMQLIGWGIAGDATHLTAPDPQGGGLRRAVIDALSMAGLPPEGIDCILAHGTGTPFNDAMEARVFAELFPHRPPLTAAKGLLGHTLGASGLLELAVAGEILRRQIIPPIFGLESAGYSGINPVCGRPLYPKQPVRTILKTASGFGGINVAVLMRRSEA